MPEPPDLYQIWCEKKTSLKSPILFSSTRPTQSQVLTRGRRYPRSSEWRVYD